MCLWRYYVPLIFEILKHEYLKINLQKHEYLKINLQRSVISGWNMFCGILFYWRCTPCSHLSNTPSFVTIGWELTEIWMHKRNQPYVTQSKLKVSRVVFVRKVVCILGILPSSSQYHGNLDGEFYFDLVFKLFKKNWRQYFTGVFLTRVCDNNHATFSLPQTVTKKNSCDCNVLL